MSNTQREYVHQVNPEVTKSCQGLLEGNCHDDSGDEPWAHLPAPPPFLEPQRHTPDQFTQLMSIRKTLPNEIL